jgi:hypothetical protein
MNTPRKDQHTESQPGNKLSPTELATAIRGFLIRDFPDVDVQVMGDSDPQLAARRYISARSAKFPDVPMFQPYDDILKRLPDDFLDEHLADAMWHVSTPDEDPWGGCFPDQLLLLEAVNAIDAYEAEESARATKTPGVEQPDQNRR